MYDDIRKNDPGRTILIYNNDPEDIGIWLVMPGVVIISDGMPIQDEKGKPIRFPVLATGRLDQMSIEPRKFEPNQ